MDGVNASQPVEIESAGVALLGDLTLPRSMAAAVLFAHGSGSGRRSRRNQSVAASLNRAGFGTLLLDLLTEEEERIDARSRAYRFDIDLLATRLTGAADWLSTYAATAGARVGLFGASTGAAAALITAADRPAIVGAVVSRGGRPDLAAGTLGRVTCPTLFIVGGNDLAVIDLNRPALAELRAVKRLEIVAGATHLFEEPGALEQVARLTSSWFTKYLR